MNLDVPYYRLGNHERVDYIPLKLALNDEAAPPAAHEYADSSAHKVEEVPTEQMSTGLILLISLLAFMALFVLLYVIYYFVILRDQPQYSEVIDNDTAVVFNKFD